ncbi:MAG: hypothetical protein ACRCY8_04275 [Dermatophilaceae bacterium]
MTDPDHVLDPALGRLRAAWGSRDAVRHVVERGYAPALVDL